MIVIAAFATNSYRSQRAYIASLLHRAAHGSFEVLGGLGGIRYSLLRSYDVVRTAPSITQSGLKKLRQPPRMNPRFSPLQKARDSAGLLSFATRRRSPALTTPDLRPSRFPQSATTRTTA